MFRADNVHEEILKDLRRYIPLPEMNQLYKTVLLDVYENYSGGVKDERRLITDQISAVNSKLSNARELLFYGKLEPDDYAIMKKENEERFRRLEAALTEAKLQKSNTQSIDNMFLKALEALSMVESIYSDGDVLTKRRVLGSIYREKWQIDKNGYRTPKLNVAASLIYQINNKLAHKKTGKNASHCIFPVQYSERESNLSCKSLNYNEL